ncbi:MAG TPA: single-stranded DNA-binding protein [Anaerolineales bacterium]|nr:single-stranded DNA-binding protein [Anaerolineales bacterium]
MDEKILGQFLEKLERIAAAVESLARDGAPQAPNYVKPLGDYRQFDWSSIAASVVQQDADGPTHVEWGGYLWNRRSPANKFDPAIWYSRAQGRDEQGNVAYLRLITFKPLKDSDPVPDKVAQAATRQPAAPAGLPAQAGPTGEIQLTLDQAPAAAAAPVASIAIPGDATAFIDRARYLQEAKQTHNLSPEAAERIATIFGVRTGQADHAPALAYLPFFGQAKKLGLDFAAARAILEESVMDLDAALQVLARQHTPPAAGARE